MKYGRYGWPYLFLRLGLGLALITTSLGLFMRPEIWSDYINIKPFISINQSSWHKLISTTFLLFGALLITNKLTKLTGWIVTFLLLLLTINNGVNITLPGNLGLLGTAFAIAVWPGSYHKKKHWWNRKNKPSKSEEE